MPLIHLVTEINAPIKRCFDLSCSIDLHMISTKKTKEKAIAGRTTGLVILNDTVTWEARHLGVKQQLISKITDFRSPDFFADEMVKGAFKRFRHEHLFEEKKGVIIMTDKFDYTAPLGILGKLADLLFLKKYMKSFLAQRNQVIKKFSETSRWKEIPGMDLNS